VTPPVSECLQTIALTPYCGLHGTKNEVECVVILYRMCNIATTNPPLLLQRRPQGGYHCFRICDL